jgi:hypothetical protein
VIFQWKKEDKSAEPKQNIPFHLMFNGEKQLMLEYTVPGGARTPRWRGGFSTGDVHNIGMAINTNNDGSVWLELVRIFGPSSRTYLTTGHIYSGLTAYSKRSTTEINVSQGSMCLLVQPTQRCAYAYRTRLFGTCHSSRSHKMFLPIVWDLSWREG